MEIPIGRTLRIEILLLLDMDDRYSTGLGHEEPEITVNKVKILPKSSTHYGL